MQGVLQKGQHLVVTGRIVTHEVHIAQDPDATPAEDAVAQRFELAGQSGGAGGSGTHEDDAPSLERLEPGPEYAGIGPQLAAGIRQADGPEGMRPLRMAEILEETPEKQAALGLAGWPPSQRSLPRVQ